jgi:hypothetical protein
MRETIFLDYFAPSDGAAPRHRDLLLCNVGKANTKEQRTKEQPPDQAKLTSRSRRRTTKRRTTKKETTQFPETKRKTVKIGASLQAGFLAVFLDLNNF